MTGWIYQGVSAALLSFSCGRCQVVCPMQEPDENHINQLGRFHVDFYEAWPELRKFRHRHTQWVTLNRKHAGIVAHDTKVLKLFRTHCYATTSW